MAEFGGAHAMKKLFPAGSTRDFQGNAASEKRKRSLRKVSDAHLERHFRHGRPARRE